MKTKTVSSLFVALTLAVCLLAIGPAAQAQLVIGSANVNQAQVSTPTGSSAVGAGILSVDPMTGLYDFSLFVAGITTADLMGAGPNSSPVHIHNASLGVNGPIVVDVGYSGTIAAVGTSGFQLNVSGGTFGGTQGALNGPTVADNLAELIAGNLYINIHTMDFPGGEIRGQLATVLVPEPATTAMGLVGLAGLGLWARRRHTCRNTAA